MAHPKQQPVRTCETCSQTFTRKPGSTEPHADFKRRRFCSSRCSRNRNLIPLRDRLEAKISRDPDGCWRWTGAKGLLGYGVLGRGTRGDGLIGAHIASYILNVGPIPAGLVLDHLCRNPSCVNPAHLEPVTRAENTRRGAKAKITMADAVRIRHLWAEGQTQRAIGLTFGLHPATISRIVCGHRWATEATMIERRRTLKGVASAPSSETQGGG